MTTPADTAAPEITIVGDGEPSDELLDTLAELLLAAVAAVDAEEREGQTDG